MSLQVKFQPNMLQSAFSYLPTRDLFQTPRVCKAWNQVVSDDRFWVRFGDSLKLLTDQEKSSKGIVKQIVLGKLGTICFSDKALEKTISSCLDTLVMDKPCAFQIIAPDAMRDPKTGAPIPYSIILRIRNITSETLPSCLLKYDGDRSIPVPHEEFIGQHCELIKIFDLRTGHLNPFNPASCRELPQPESSNEEPVVSFLTKQRESFTLKRDKNWFQRMISSHHAPKAKLEISIDRPRVGTCASRYELTQSPLDPFLASALKSCGEKRELARSNHEHMQFCCSERIQPSEAPRSEQKDEPKDS